MLLSCRFYFWIFLAAYLFKLSINSRMDILIFGGNGFIGSHVSEILIHQGHNLTLINRNHWSWDTKDKIYPKVNTIVLDRLSQKGVEIFVDQIVKNRRKPFDVVIDFSAYRLEAVKSYYDHFSSKNLCKLYIFISTDSVYEVCQKFVDKNFGEPIEESECVRPEDEKIRQELNAKDSYGHRKLEIEEYLRRKAEERGGVPYLILRLPDVLGERDSTQRWWKYQLWLEHYDFLKVPLVIPSFARELKTSYVYVQDVARFINAVVLTAAENGGNFDHVSNKIYNFAYDEPKLLRELLVHMKQATRSRAEIKALSGQNDAEKGDNSASIWYFPSVTRGPLDISQLRRDFPNFEFTPWSTMIHRVIQFYKEAFLTFPKERDETARDLCDDLNFDSKKCEEFCTRLLIEAEKKWKSDL